MAVIPTNIKDTDCLLWPYMGYQTDSYYQNINNKHKMRTIDH